MNNREAATKERDFGLDLARGMAGVLVLSAHFLSNTGYYEVPLAGKCMFLAR